MKDLSEVMRQAQEMQRKLTEAQAKMDTLTAEGSAGGGLVTVRLKGKGELDAVRFDPSLLKPDEAEIVDFRRAGTPIRPGLVLLRHHRSPAARCRPAADAAPRRDRLGRAGARRPWSPVGALRSVGSWPKPCAFSSERISHWYARGSFVSWRSTGSRWSRRPGAALILSGRLPYTARTSW